MNCNFSFKHYKECMEIIAATQKNVEIIHDIDYTPNNILQIAKVEHDNYIKATYFIRLHSKTYNAFDYTNFSNINFILNEYSHDIGLHFEPSFFTNADDVYSKIAIELEVLSKMFNREIKKLSIHEPARFGSIDESKLSSNIQYYCYGSNYYNGKKYISDSGARWREGCMCQHIDKHDNLIVLTHPNWWYEVTSAENY